MRRDNVTRLTTKDIQDMTTSDLERQLQSNREEMRKLRRFHPKRKELEVECCYIQRELQLRSSWVRASAFESLRFTKPLR